jgi:hypothetical protein
MTKNMGYFFWFSLFSFLLAGTLSIHYPAQAHFLFFHFFTADTFSALSYLSGILFSINAFLKLKKHHRYPEKIPLSQPITLMLVSALLLALPTLLLPASSCRLGSNSTVQESTDFSTSIKQVK